MGPTKGGNLGPLPTFLPEATESEAEKVTPLSGVSPETSSLVYLVFCDVIPGLWPLPLGTRTGQQDCERKQSHRERRRSCVFLLSAKSQPWAGVWLPGVWEASKSPGVPFCYPRTPLQLPTSPSSAGACLLVPPCFQLSAFLLSSLHSGPFLLPLWHLTYLLTLC